MTDSNMQTAALALAALGKPVFPCWNTPDDEDRHKTPMTPHGFKDATTDPAKIKRWWRKSPNALIGMPTGDTSGIAVLDLDIKKGKDGYTAVPDWKSRSPVIAKTGSGGAHLYFNAAGAPNSTQGTLTSGIAPGVDTRGTGGYVIVPPSPGYSWLNGSDLSQLPSWPNDLRPPEIRAPRPEVTTTPTLPDCIMELLKTQPGGGLSNDPADLPPPIDLPTIKAMLSVIDPDIDRPEWIAIGCVLYKYLDYDEGFAVWDEWSSNGGKYRARKIKGDWRSIAAGNGYDYNIGTLIHHANEADPNWRSRIEHEKYPEPIEPQADVAVLVEPADGLPFMITRAQKDQLRQLGHDDEAIRNMKPEDAQRILREAPPTADPETKSETKPEAKPAASVEPDAGALIISSRKLVANFKPPDYLIEGLLQRRFLYGLTAQTNAGKTTVALRLALHVAIGLPLGDREIEQGKVLFFAGENPDDVTMRWIKLCEETKSDPETDQVFWVPGIYSIKKLRKVIDTQTKKCGPFALVVIDSAAAYFEGDEENSNTQLGAYARMLRTLVEIYGGPTILVICHPIKNADQDNLIPRGGGAFVNEIDGNLVLKIVSEAPKVVDLHWQVKFRGPEFSPIPFMIIAGYSKQIKDSKGREISTIYAKPLSATERAAAEGRGQANQDKLLIAMKERTGASLAELAKACGWFYKSGDPNKTFTNQTMHDLEARGLVRQDGRHWKLTKAGLAVDTESM
jgi:hypothetical protein